MDAADEPDCHSQDGSFLVFHILPDETPLAAHLKTLEFWTLCRAAIGGAFEPFQNCTLRLLFSCGLGFRRKAWTLARYLCSPIMQREVSRLYQSLQLYHVNSAGSISEPDQALPCGFPFEGPTNLQGIFVRLPGATTDSPQRWLILQLEQCSAPFPFNRVIVERDNDSAPGENAADENLMPAWTKADESVSDREKLAPDRFQANEEPSRGHEPLRIELMGERFEYLRDKRLVKEEKIVQRYRFLPTNADGTQVLTGLGTGQGTWGTSNLQLTKLTTLHTPAATPAKRRKVPVLPASLETFVHAIELLREQRQPFKVAFVGVGEGDTSLGAHALTNFPSHDPTKGKRIAWAWIKKHNRPRHVAIAEIRSEKRVAYVLEIERTKQEHATLILARNDLEEVSPSEWQAFLLLCAVRRGWPSEDEVPGYRRKTTTHEKLISVSVFELRIWRKVVKLLGNGTGS